MILTDRALKIKAEANNGERLKLHFDTGCSTAGLYYRYYEGHKSELDASGKREHITGGGFNIVVTKEILRLPSFRIKVGKVPVELKNLAVDTTNGDFQTSEDAGIIGMDMVNQFDCVTINLKEMFLKLE